MNNEI